MAEINSIARQSFQKGILSLRYEEKLCYTQEKKFLADFETHAQKDAKLHAAEACLNATSFLLAQNVLSFSLLGIKNEGMLNNARKNCYRSILYIEEVTSNSVDAPLSEYLSYQQNLASLSDEDRYNLSRKLLFTIEYLEVGYGENTKWRWSMADLFQRAAVVVRNLMNFEELGKGFDPSREEYQSRVLHWEMVERSLEKAATIFRNKYETTNQTIADIRLAIEILSALRKLLTLVGKSKASEKERRRVEIWKSKMDDDLRHHKKS